MYSTTGPDASNFVSTYNIAFYSIAGVSLVLLTGLTILMFYFIFRYNRKKNKEAVQIEGNTKLEIIWTVIPIILVLGMFYFGWADLDQTKDTDGPFLDIAKLKEKIIAF